MKAFLKQVGKKFDNAGQQVGQGVKMLGDAASQDAARARTGINDITPTANAHVAEIQSNSKLIQDNATNAAKDLKYFSDELGLIDASAKKSCHDSKEIAATLKAFNEKFLEELKQVCQKIQVDKSSLVKLNADPDYQRALISGAPKDKKTDADIKKQADDALAQLGRDRDATSAIAIKSRTNYAELVSLKSKAETELKRIKDLLAAEIKIAQAKAEQAKQEAEKNAKAAKAEAPKQDPANDKFAKDNKENAELKARLAALEALLEAERAKEQARKAKEAEERVKQENEAMRKRIELLEAAMRNPNPTPGATSTPPAQNAGQNGKPGEDTQQNPQPNTDNNSGASAAAKPAKP